ncbi:MAG: hypothetical protein ABR598_03355 [Candidatus Dormibacteria bacterium]
MFLLSVVRLATCMARVRQIRAMVPRPLPGRPRLVNPGRPHPLLWLLAPTDLDLLLPVVAVAALEVLTR